MIKHDFHIHTEFSYDSRIKGKELLQRAIELGYQEIAITEHLDLLPQEVKLYGLPSLRKYSAYIDALRLEYPEITLHKGIELGDYHHVKEYAETIIQGYDLYPILGSVHFLSDQINVAIPMPSELNPAQVRDYYEQNLELVSICDIDVLAHLGVYKRYYNTPPDEREHESLIREIFGVMIQKGIALEINFSSLYKPYQRCLPEPYYLELFQKMGGTKIVYGSDAHRIENFGITLQKWRIQ